MRIKSTLVLLVVVLFLSPSVWAGKLYVTIANNIERGEFDSFELSLSSGGNYATPLDIGGTYYFNKKPNQSNFNLLSLDVFSALESVQEYNFLLAAGIRFFGITADLKPANEEDNSFSYGLMPGIDIGYRFRTPIPTVLLLSVDYAPDIITGGKVDDVFISNLLYEIMFTPIVITHISYRYGKADFPQPGIFKTTQDFENSIGLGLKIRF